MSSDLLADFGVFRQKSWSPWFVQEYGRLGGGWRSLRFVQVHCGGHLEGLIKKRSEKRDSSDGRV